MAEFKTQTNLQRLMLQKLTDAVREYLEVIEKPTGSRHRKSILTFVGDRYKPVEISCRFIVQKKDDDQ